jgi:hypothetical protein
MPARQQPRAQRPSTADRLDAADPPGVGGELPLLAFELRPIDAVFMVILQ